MSRALAEGTGRLQAAGIAAAGTDARRLLCHALDTDAAGLRLIDGIGEAALAAYLDAIRRRARREPVSQIVGHRDFWTHRFRVTPDVLDPRPETEALVAAALEEPFTRVLDMGTGSGCILISLLAERPEARGVGIDTSPEALLIAGDNAARIGVADRLVLPLSDWWDDVGGRYDLIVSNPPYIGAAEMADLDADVAEWEPRQALTDGGDGLGAYREIAGGARPHLTPAGRLMVEIGPTQARDVSAILASGGLTVTEVRRDLDGRDRVVIARNPL